MTQAKDVETEFKKEVVWDLVTVYDRKIEEVLIYKIKEQYPDHK